MDPARYSESAKLLAPLEPDENALTPLFRSHIDDSMLRHIAEADYEWEAEKCYRFLQPVLFTGASAPDHFNIQEVLELIRWSEPEDPAWSPGGYGPRGHWMRLFACAHLVRLAARYPDSFFSECDTYAQLIASAISLGSPVARASASLLAWRFLTAPGDPEDRPFLAFAILLLAAHLEGREGRGQWLKSIAAWVMEEEDFSRKTSGWHSASPSWNEWLLGLTNFRQRESVWRSLAHRILVEPESPHPHAAKDDLYLIGSMVTTSNNGS